MAGLELHSDLLLVQRLSSLDGQIDVAIATIRELEDGVRAAVAAVKKGMAEHEAAKAELAVLVERERVLNRKLHSYQTQRDRTRTLIDEGKAPDFIVAERQFAQCAELADETEFTLLELMEEKDGVEARIAAIEQGLRSGHANLDAARGARDAGRPPEEVIVKKLRPERAAAWADFPSEIKGSYELLRKRRAPTLVFLKGGICEHCHIQARAQVVIEVERQRGTHRCSGCGAWILDVRREASDDENADE